MVSDPQEQQKPLTRCEQDIMCLLAQGKPVKIIARELGKAVGTVQKHMISIYRKLGAQSRTEAVAQWQVQTGMPEPDSNQ